jgi:DNA-binding phage protein
LEGEIKMAKIKISTKQKKSSIKSKAPLLVVHDPYSKELANPKRIKRAILQALVDGDLESVRDLLIAHLRTVNKSKLATNTKLGRQTLYDLIDSKKEFNPSIKTLTLILDDIAA